MYVRVLIVVRHINIIDIFFVWSATPGGTDMFMFS